MKIVCLDIETTGCSRNSDEVLQLSMINEGFNVLFDEYIKPVEKKDWYYAQKVHNISPEMVKDKNILDYHKEEVEDHINYADLIVGYNVKNFDIPFLRSKGIYIGEDIPVFDVMYEFVPIYQKISGNRKSQKLTVCADYYGYQFNAHNSLEDVKATLHCYYGMKKG